MSSKLFKPLVIMAAFMLIVGMACGFSVGNIATEAPPATQAPEPTKTEAVEPTPVVEETEAAAPTGAITNLEDAKNATIQIEAQGTYVNPDFSVSYNTAGYGSGFIIDPSGIAVTNNHVVTGAPLLKVWIGGDRTKTYNAKVLGVSECADLAVIDLEGDGYSYLDWREGPVNVGLEVYAAGFPLGEPEFTMTKGIVSKEQAGGETSWASVDYVIEHDATINPGNSGGPLLDENAQVVGVNYRGRETNQYFAIGKDLAQRVIENLKGGKNVDSIGVNGEAFSGEDFSGIWVYSVESGSPADEAGVQGGDIITMMENLVLATDGSMADYCDILRSHDPDDPLGLEVLRYASGEILSGQLNGRKLETAATFGGEEQVDTGDVVVEDTGTTYTSYVTVTDDYGAIEVNVPAEWADVNGANWEYDGEVIGSAVTAAASLDNWNNSWNESGVFFGVSDDLATLGGYVNLLDVEREYYRQYCKIESREDYQDNLYRGKYDVYTNCENSGNVWVVLSAVPIDDPQSYLMLVETNITKEADWDALSQIVASFQVVGSLP